MVYNIYFSQKFVHFELQLASYVLKLVMAMTIITISLVCNNCCAVLVSAYHYNDSQFQTLARQEKWVQTAFWL